MKDYIGAQGHSCLAKAAEVCFGANRALSHMLMIIFCSGFLYLKDIRET